MIEVSCGPLTGGGKATIKRSHYLARRFLMSRFFHLLMTPARDYRRC
jgi:hypothetical protein